MNPYRDIATDPQYSYGDRRGRVAPLTRNLQFRQPFRGPTPLQQVQNECADEAETLSEESMKFLRDRARDLGLPIPGDVTKAELCVLLSTIDTMYRRRQQSLEQEEDVVY